MRFYSFLLGVFILILSACRQAPVEYTENKQQLSPRERYGDLFIAVQTEAVFPDGKTFVDCRPKFPTDQILDNYEQSAGLEGFDLKAFVEEHFELPKAYASGFQSDTSRSVEEHINVLWDVLTRNPDDADPGTLIPLPKPYIVPGGRFGEIYYWDSYFTMLGLKVAGKVDMIENMIDNFAFLIDTIGFIPNGNRTYFTTRSQPPFFAAMIRLLAQEKDSTVFSDYLPQLEKEYAFWMDGQEALSETNPAEEHLVRLSDGVVLNRYWDAGDYPREEMYLADLETAEKSDRPAPEVYAHLRAACESGWDFSSRWFADPQQLHTIHTNDIIPVDLNALLYNLELVLARAYTLSGQKDKADATNLQAAQRKAAILQYCWDEESGFFRDYDYTAGTFTPVLSLAGLYPLYFNIADQAQSNAVAEVVRQQFLQAGGVLSTLNQNGQQWDSPNGWAPLQLITIEGLEQYGHSDLASEIAQRWIELNTRVYKNTGKLVEKYNVMDISLESGGGEYPVQDGFGWTNGVLLYLLEYYQ